MSKLRPAVLGLVVKEPRNQSCEKCGTGLLISEDGKKIVQGYSPFTAEEYKFKSPSQATPEPEKGKNSIVKRNAGLRFSAAFFNSNSVVFNLQSCFIFSSY